jgi:hypothetical protein
MTRFARQHDYRLGRALILAFVVVIVGSWIFPVDWLRFFGHRLDGPEATEIGLEPWIRLIPEEALESTGDLVPMRITVGPTASPDLDQSVEAPRHEWSFDPSTTYRPLAGATEPLAPGTPDSLLLRSDLLNSLRLANWDAVFALLDTTQAGRAREQLAETDDWVHRILAPVWEAQGRGRRNANLWHRVVGEVEAEGSQ